MKGFIDKFKDSKIYIMKTVSQCTEYFTIEIIFFLCSYYLNYILITATQTDLT